MRGKIRIKKIKIISKIWKHCSNSHKNGLRSESSSVCSSHEPECKIKDAKLTIMPLQNTSS